METAASAGRQLRTALAGQQPVRGSIAGRRAPAGAHAESTEAEHAAEHAMAMIACNRCKRQIAEQSIRCLYCGYPVAATDEQREEEEARLARLTAMYSAGLGLPGKHKRHWIERLREESVPTKLLAAGLLLPLMMIMPFKAIGWIREIFTP